MVPKDVAALLLAFFLLISPVHAQTTASTVSLTSCTPNAVVAEDNSFVTNSGDAVVFSCTLTNKGATEATVLLSGERTKDNSTDSTSATSVSSSVLVPPQKTIEADIPFIALFENGTYHYAITLRNLSDGTSFGSSLKFSSTLTDETIRITDAILDKEVYALGDMVSLVVTVATSTPGIKGKATASFFLDIVAKGKDGKACLYVVSGRSIISTRESVNFSLSTLPINCSVVTLGVILKTIDGFPQDSRDIPLVVRASNSSTFSTDSTTTRLIMFALLVIVSLTALIWTLRIQRLRSRRNTTL